jgi:hypothetical protein
MGYFGNVLISLDQLGNTFAGGNPDNTISARIGYHTSHKKKPSRKISYWNFFRLIVDFTFYPVDGEGHCHHAYHNDSGEDYNTTSKDLAIVCLSIFIIPLSILISIILYILYAIGKVSPKKIDHVEKRLENMIGVSNKLTGIEHAIEEFKLEGNTSNLKKETDYAAKVFKSVAQKILDS